MCVHVYVIRQQSRLPRSCMRVKMRTCVCNPAALKAAEELHARLNFSIFSEHSRQKLKSQCSQDETQPPAAFFSSGEAPASGSKKKKSRRSSPCFILYLFYTGNMYIEGKEAISPALTHPPTHQSTNPTRPPIPRELKTSEHAGAHHSGHDELHRILPRVVHGLIKILKSQCLSIFTV